MAEITTPQVVAFANQRARVLADLLEATYETCKRFQAEWASVTVPDLPDLIADGSATDGRKRISGAHLHGLKAAADAVVTWFETGTPSRIEQVRQITVNGQPRF